MTESNTPPENPKKKSAFSRFFSRKKTPKTEHATDSSNNPSEAKPANVELQAIPPQEPISSEANNVSNKQEVSPAEAISNTEAIVNTTQEAPTATPEAQSTQTTAPADQTLITENTIETPLSNTVPLSNAPTSSNEKRLVDSKPLIEANSSNSDASTDNEQSSAKVSTPSPEPLATDKPLNSVTQPTDDQAPAADNAKVATVEEGLNKSRSSFFQKISNVFKGSFNLDDELFDELEELLITSDIGIDASLNLVEKLRTRVKNEKIQDANGVIIGLRSEIAQMLQQSEQEWQFEHKPYVILMVGINGAGKTTTTAKIAKHFQDQGKSVMLAAADTFRAAAVEQLQEWGQRLDIPVIAQSHGADAAAVAHDALTSAIARNVDVLMIDTAGRLHTQSDLMEQLTKVNRVLAKIDPSTPHEVMQVLDAGTGQNALVQLEHFQKAVGVSSICLSKLDGSAKGGIAISLSEKTKLPIRFIGTGEGFSDLQRFSAQEFADALVPSLK